MPLAFAGALALLGLSPMVSGDPTVTGIFLGAAAVLAGWAAAVYVGARRAGRSLELTVALKMPHYLQAAAQIVILVYWGWHVRSVYAFAPFILAQVLFAYGIDSLLTWSRRDRYGIGFGPVPIIFSINLFTWFRPEWFYWQFAMIALGFLVKEFIRWEKNGRSAHIFNPSSFPLAVASVLLLLTGTTDRTMGLEIAQTLNNPPHIFALLFAVSVPAQAIFGVATMTVAAVLSAYAFGLAYFAVTGMYFFYDAYIPIAVFLGMLLLFTDPATSPRSELGRVMFGVSYGFLIIAMVVVLESFGAPTFYDKLLPVPILNLMVRRLDLVAGKIRVPAWIPAQSMPIARKRLAVTGGWVVIFGLLSATGGFGDHHPGQYLPFWVQACDSTGRERACDHLAQMRQTYCDRGSGWACNELGIQRASLAGDVAAARAEFERACALDFRAACSNVLQIATGSLDFATGPPPPQELPIVLRGSKGPVMERDPEALYALGCTRGWTEMCGGEATVTAASGSTY